jgi:Restriction endonuclease S subunits
MGEWRELTLGELVHSGFLELGDGYRTKRAEHGIPGIPILRVAEVLDGTIVPTFENHVSNAFRPAMGDKVSRPGDVVLTTKGTVGRVAIIPDDAPEFVYSPQLCYFRVKPDGPLSARHLYYWFKSDSFWSQARQLKSQTDMADYINLADIRSLVVQVPPSDTQAAMGAVLRALDDKIAVNERIVSACHELAQAHTLAALADGPTVPLGEIAAITMGSSPPGDTYNEDGVGLPFYQGTRDFGTRFPTRRVWCSQPVRVAARGATLVSVRAPVGRLNIATEECCIGRGLASLVTRTRTPSVLFHSLAARSEIWQPYESEGTVFGAINRKQLDSTQVLSTREEPARNLETVLEPLDGRVWSATMESAALADLRDTLLPKLMSGELRVREAEGIVGGAL